jgi:predicted PurR-regulated permease PerM
MAITERIKKATTRSSKENKIADDYGTLGAPINRSHPFYFGFIATLGALTAIVLMRALASVSQIFVLILIALFLATGLNPAVEALRKRNLSRSAAVTVIFSSVILFVIFFALVVVPPVISQGTNLIESGPQLLQDLMKNETINQLNTQYGLIDTLQERLKWGYRRWKISAVGIFHSSNNLGFDLVLHNLTTPGGKSWALIGACKPS